MPAGLTVSTLKRIVSNVADGGTSRNAARMRRESATDPTLDDVLRAAGFEVSEAGRQRWRQQLALPIPPAALEEARQLFERARGSGQAA
jgi:hypothetical protein